MNTVELFPYIDTAVSAISIVALAGSALCLILACLPRASGRLGRPSQMPK